MAADAATSILPVWMVTQQALQQEDPDAGAAALAAELAAGGTSSGSAGSTSTQLELRTAAEAVCSALQRADISGARLMQLSFGDYIVVFPTGRRGQAAVVPAGPGRIAINDSHQPLGSAQVAARVLAARGVAVVHDTGSELELLAQCGELLQGAAGAAAGTAAEG